MNDLAFADATRPTRSVILGLPMLDYSLGHELQLLQQRNPLAVLTIADFNQLTFEEQRHAVIRAALICNRDWSNSRKPHRWMALWSWKNRRADYRLAIAEFRNYRAAGSTFPFITPPEKIGQSPGRELGSPNLARIFTFGHGLFGEKVFDYPLGCLQWLYFSAAELDGNVLVENAFERQVREEIAQHRADYEREEKEKQKEAACPP